jgi:hypothetical protein
MPVQYVRVKATVEGFTPVSRSTGNLAIVGAATKGNADEPVHMTRPADATTEYGDSPLATAIKAALSQSPAASQVWAVRAGTTNTLPAQLAPSTLAVLESLDVQFVVIAGTPLSATNGGENGIISQLATHVTSVSDGADGKERMGVVMLAKGPVADPATLITGDLVSDRMIYVAHQSDDDVAAAVASTVAGYPPHVSLVLKQIAVKSTPFSATQVDVINGSEEFGAAVAGKGLNWLTSPALLGGQGVYLGEGYTGSKLEKKYIDVMRTLDDVTFKLKARLINAIGNLRVSRAGLRGLSVQLEAVLEQLVRDGVLDSYDVVIPVLDLLDTDPSQLSPVQLQLIKNAQDSRAAKVFVSVDYNGAIHRVNLELNFR